MSKKRLVFSVMLAVMLGGVGDVLAGDVQSRLGFVAKVLPGEEGTASTEIWEGKKKIATVPYASAVSFSPDGRVLLLHEAEASDDARHFLLNVAGGEYIKNQKDRLKWVVGNRYVSKTGWTKDSKYVILHEGLSPEKSKPVRYTVAKYIAPAKSKQPKATTAITTLFVGAHKAPCTGVAPMECLMAKSSADPSVPYEYFYSTIEGFDWKPGFEYELSITEQTPKNTPADASAKVYKLVKVISKKPFVQH